MNSYLHMFGIDNPKLFLIFELAVFTIETSVVIHGLLRRRDPSSKETKQVDS